MATERRLIDANALQLEPDPWGGMNGVICVGRSGGKTMATVQATLKCMIDNAPTVDAVEVVRCKDCKYSEWDCDCSLYLCLYHGCDWNDGEHFCSYGKRRTDNERKAD